MRDAPGATVAALAAAASAAAPFMTAQEAALTLAGLERLQCDTLQPSVAAALLTRLEACAGELRARPLRRALDALCDMRLRRGEGLSEGLARGLQGAAARTAPQLSAKHRAHVAQRLLALRCAVPAALGVDLEASAGAAAAAALAEPILA